MRDEPNTEVTISEIMGAVTLRVLWAAMKTVLGLVLVFLIIFGISQIFQSYFGLGDDWQSNWQWGLPVVIFLLWAALHEATGHRSFHREQWYFPKTNAFTSLLMSAYVVLSVWCLFSLEKGLIQGALFFTLYGVPAFTYYILNCVYYPVLRVA